MGGGMMEQVGQRKRYLSPFLVGFLVVLTGSAFASTTCMQFLRISTVPRIAAMGEATSAVRDATWAEANPSHLTGLDGSLITFSHTAWFEDISLEMLTVGTSSGKHGFGISVVGLHTDPLDEYNEFDVYQGSFRYFDLFVSGSYARALSQALSIGVTGKTLYEKIAWDSATGFAIDLGLGYTVPMNLLAGGVSAGLAMRNFGTKMGYHDEDFDLPLTWQGGVSYKPMWLPEYMSAVIAVDYEKARERDGGVLAGLEVGLADIVALRVGHRGPYENGDLTFGMGLALSNTSIDYAFVDLGEKLGGTHRVSLGFKVGAIFPSPQASQ